MAIVVDASLNEANELTINEVWGAIHCGLAVNRDRVLALRLGVTDFCSAYGLRRSPEMTAYDVQIVASVIADVVNVLGRADGTGAVDYTVNAAAGFPQVTGAENVSTPVNHVLPAWDVSCGLYAALSVASAVYRREITGAGNSIASRITGCDSAQIVSPVVTCLSPATATISPA